MKPFSQIAEEAGFVLTESRKATTGDWTVGKVQQYQDANISGKAGDFKTNIHIGRDARGQWVFRGEITDGSGNSVQNVYISGAKTAKAFETKWKASAGNFIKGPDMDFLKKVMSDVHSASASDFFYTKK